MLLGEKVKASVSQLQNTYNEHDTNLQKILDANLLQIKNERREEYEF